VERRAALQLDRPLARRPAVDPGFERVTPGGKTAEPKVAVIAGRDKVRRVEHENEAAHVFVNVATQSDESRDIEDLGWDWLFVGPVTAEIETFRGRVGKDIVIGVVVVWKFHARADAHRQERRDEREIFLRDLFRSRRGLFQKRTFEINDGQRRTRRQYPAFGHDLVAFVYDRRRMRFRQLHAPLDHNLRESDRRERAQNGERNKKRTHPHKIALTILVDLKAKSHRPAALSSGLVLPMPHAVSF